MVDAEASDSCAHVTQIKISAPTGSSCADCLRSNDAWLQLRMCMECGYVGCCDSSKNQHALEHYRATRHPIARSIQPGEEWAWCYVDKLWFERVDVV